MSTLSPSTDQNQTLKIVLAFAAIYTIWGTTYLAIRLAVETIPAFYMAGTRFLIAGIVTFAFLRARGVPVPRRLHWRSAAIIGALLIVGGNGFVTWSEQQVPSSIAALVVATVPLWITLFGWLLYRDGRPSKQIVVGVILGFFGIGLLIGPGQILGTSTFDWPSLLILLMAPILWSLGSLYSRRANLPENIFMSTAIEMLAGGALLMIAGTITGEATELNFGEITTRSVVSMLYLTVFGSIVALTAYVWLLKTVHPTRVATYTYVNPVIAIFLGWLILSEPITSQMLIAFVIIILAVVLITTQRQREPEPQPQMPPSTIDVPCESTAAAD